MNTNLAQELTADELPAIEGGNFAYDVGRVVRFIVLAGGGEFAGQAVADWVATDAMMQA
ncbi:MAG TPA: hypothetical protein VHD61_12270 [Lacunisphaera sp.]|nr:hypothetical protein [Lacunisphaera sp.]